MSFLFKKIKGITEEIIKVRDGRALGLARAFRGSYVVFQLRVKLTRSHPHSDSQAHEEETDARNTWL